MKNKIFSIVLLLFFSTLFFSCTKKNTPPPKLIIATASSAQFAIQELADVFESKNNVLIEIINGASGKLTTQIINGAPYDVFFSANMVYPNLLFEKNISSIKPRMYGYGVPVLWTLNMDLNLDKNAIFLLDNSIKKIALANPLTAPFGIKAVQFMKDHKTYDTLESKLVFGESISQVNKYILSNSVSIGFGAKSIVVSSKIAGKGNYMILGKKYWIEQGMVELSNTPPSKIKTKFIEFVFSDEGRTILSRYGY